MEDKSLVNTKHISDEESKSRLLKQQMIFDQQQRDVQVGFSRDLLFIITFFFLVSILMPYIKFAGTKANSSHYQIWYSVYENEVPRGVPQYWYKL